ncbi:MAG TPA: hypothetical protein VIL36_16205 [Acidimicrobiales bacterium]
MRRAKAAAVAVMCLAMAAGCRWIPTDTWSPGAADVRREINALLDQADEAEAEGDTAAAEQLRAEATELECERFACVTDVGTTTVLFDPTLAGGFFDAPWPSDTRRKPDGSLDLSGFPGRDTIAVADIVLGRGEAATFGFGPNSAVYFRTTGPIDPASLPASPEHTVLPRSTVLLLDLDDPTADPVPLLADVKADGTALRPSNLVTLLPYPGHPLRPSTRYAAAIFDEVLDPAGDRLAPSPLLAQLDGPAPAGVDAATWAALRQDRDDTIAAVRDRTLWHPSELVAFTAFTTQDTSAELEALAAAVAALPQPEVLSRTPATTPCTPGGISRSSGRVALPIWQAGERPFLNDGGGIVIGPDGRAVQQGVELGSSGQGVLLDVAIPCGPAPEDGWPVLLWISGTGGSARATPTELGPNLPYVVLSVAPLYSGDRLVPVPAPFDTPDFQFYNHLNPLAARTNQLQQAADVLYLERLAHSFTVTPAEEALGVDGRIDTSTVVVAGHSQGAGTVPHTLAVAPPQVVGGFMSAAGGGLYHSIVHRGDVRALVDALTGAEPGEIDMFHPYPQVLQTFAEVADPANHAAAITADVALYAGLRDGCTSIETTTHLAQALGIPIVNPQARRPLFGPEGLAHIPGYTSPLEPAVTTAPVSENLPGGRTGAVVEVDSGHFGARAYPAIGRSFVDSIAQGGPVTIDPGPTPPVDPGDSCPRFDPPPLPPTP